MSPDRNLLFGILAVQMNFISRDALIAAMNAWVIEKHRPLADILHEQGTLSKDHSALLEAMVVAHLKTHDNDPQKSLAALSSVQAVKEALGQVADAEVQQSLMHLPVASTVDPHGTGSFIEREKGSRFRILRAHAKGGLGEVFVAEDLELHRQVALKEIQDQHADNENSRGRFVLEAEVTGGLEHPNIVPVYGLGTYGDGRPFYAMRFIRGDSLKDALLRFHGKAQGRPSLGFDSMQFRNLLKRFVDVCNAIAYAHSRGILHRDLKPGNIMLGKYGETLVVDWGLAKMIGRAESPSSGTNADEERILHPASGSNYLETHAGSTIGTPGFMSPEQAEGRLDELSPDSDVYSLGATLYVILTGRTAFQGDTGEILRKTIAGEFAPPRSVRNDVPAPLNAVVIKAMSRRKQDRYATATELAEEIEHYLADEPVVAYREPFAARAKRWARKHPGYVSGMAATILVGIIGLSAGLYFVNAEKNRTELARDAEERQRLKAEENERLAMIARELARLRFVLALNAYKDMVFGIQDKLHALPGTLELRRELLVNAREGLQKLLAEAEKQGIDTDPKKRASFDRRMRAI